MALRNRFEGYGMSSRDREPLEGEAEIAQLKEGPELRRMALGSRYESMDLNDGQLREVEDDLRKARMYEVLALATTMKTTALDEQRRQVAEGHAVEVEQRRRQVVQMQLLRQRALVALQREAEAIRMRQSDQLAEDRRRIVQREKDRLMDRRRRFETEHGVGGDGGNAAGGPGATPGGNVASSVARSVRGGGGGDAGGTIAGLRHSTRDGAAVLVMNIALGNGKEDRIVVRQNDDPKRVAVTFAQRHKLPEHAVYNLTQQIQANLTASALRTSTAAGSASAARAPAMRRSTTPTASTAASRSREASNSRQLFGTPGGGRAGTPGRASTSRMY